MSEVATSIRILIQDFYHAYNPEKLDQVDAILAKYAGKEHMLLDHLIAKYNLDRYPPFELFMSGNSRIISRQKSRYVANVAQL